MKMDKQCLVKTPGENTPVQSKVAPLWGAALYQKIVLTLLFCLSFASYGKGVERPQASLIYQSIDGEELVSLPLNTQVKMKVSGWINRVKVRQEFRWIRFQVPIIR